MIVSFLPAEALDALCAATGFDLGEGGYEYKYKWLLERIGMLKKRADMADVIHDNQDTTVLVEMILAERRWSAGQTQTIMALQAELERLRKCHER